MPFIQLIDYETERAAEIDAAMRSAVAEMPAETKFVRLQHTQDHDNPRHFTTIVEFPDYDTAMANSTRPETDEMAQQLAAVCTSGPTYRNLDVQLTLP